MKILKFGGSSIATSERIQSVIEILKKEKENSSLTVVFSAFGGITDQLIETSKMALSNDQAYKEKLGEIEKRHLDAVRDLIGIQNRGAILSEVKSLFNELEDVLHGVFLVRERTLRTLDYIMSFGERLSCFILSAALKERAFNCSFLDARSIILTDNSFGHAKVDFAGTDKKIRKFFNAHQEVQVVTGFIGASPDGETTTIGRSGSDYTAAILAGALNAETLEIWTDVDGMMTSDPRLVSKAFTVPQISYDEAMELSHFGAKVIFPSTMQPAMANKIPIWIKNTFNPNGKGTLISAEVTNGKLIKGISSMNGISLINIQGSGLVGVAGISMRIFSVLGREKVNIILISQASSEHSICFAIETKNVRLAKESIEKEFQYEIQNGEMDPVAVEDDLAIVAIVGENMKQNPGTSGRMFGALGKNGVNVNAIAQGSSELNISAVIKQQDIKKGLNALHEAFFLSDHRVLNLFMVGAGLIGKSLMKMVKNQAKKLAEESLLEINLIGLANSKKMVFNEQGLDLNANPGDLLANGEEMEMEAFTAKMMSLNLSNSIFLDCTSSEAVTDFYKSILASNISIVTPNKKGNSGSLEKYKQLKITAKKRGVKFLYETNVGAGLPVINTLNDLIWSGDKVMKIEGVLSGTLNYIFSAFKGDKKFSDVVKEAKEKGYTEPDPRDDLNGMDVARKILILSREAGIDLEIDDVRVENLVPENCRGEMDIAKFFTELEAHNDAFEEMKNIAAAKKERLRYMAVLENGAVKIKLDSVGEQHPFYSLDGSDNIILLTTERYHERPMVIRGPGAGAEVTAAGVFADIIRIGHYGN